MELTKLLDKNGNPSRLKKKMHSELMDKVCNMFPSEDANTSIYLALHGIEAPVCQFCNGPLIIRNFKIGFASRWCSTKCRDSDPSFGKQMSDSLKAYDKDAALIKRKKTNNERYGVEHQMQRQEIADMVSKINKVNSPSMVAANKKTCLERYGVSCTFQIPHIQDKIAAIKESRPQRIVREFVEGLGFECGTDRTIIYPYEIDILIPEKKIGIEVNGVFWHSSFDRDSDREMRTRHLKKTKSMIDAGFRLIHFTDIEILNNQETVFSMLRAILGKSRNRIFARKCIVAKVSSNEAMAFLNSTHIQGCAPCSLFIGLYEGDELVSVMGFSKSRFDKSFEWELVRFSSKKDTTVVGGFSKLLSHFKKSNDGSIVSYADFSRSNGDVYEKNGFEQIGISAPSYRWVDMNKGILLNRHMFMRRNLPKMFGENFNTSLTEAENCWNNGLRRIWDCGQIKYVLNI